MLGGELPAQQAIHVFVAHTFAAGYQRVRRRLRCTVDVGVIGVGLVQAAIDAERQGVGQRAAEVEVGALARAFGIVFGEGGVGGQRAVQLVGGAFGDDVDDTAHGTGAITGGGRAAQDFNAFDFFGRYPVGFATGITVTAPAVTHRVARGGWLAIDQNQGVFRAHAAQVDLAVIATTAAGTVAGQVHTRLAADDLRQVVSGRAFLDVFGGDDRHAGRLLEFFGGGAQYTCFTQHQGLGRAIHRQVCRLDRHFVALFFHTLRQ